MERLNELKQKYDRALKTMTETGVRLQNLHVQDNKLFLRGTAPTEQAKNQVWTALKSADPTYADVTLDLTIDSTLPAPQPHAAEPAAGGASGRTTYTVQAGDTLSKISRQFYGDANRYQRIFEANRDVLNDPDTIRPGQVLTIPSA